MSVHEGGYSVQLICMTILIHDGIFMLEMSNRIFLIH